ncbi:MAG: hypothetical protein DLM60_14320 [Pseudonocardiales bacterium]|nr:DUF5753 domain-containing protein [Actinomycetota bacterium]PZS17084.1 MAG: hypothetical protein DLM60_14320 [Pseudonocardiales bacterium]
MDGGTGNGGGHVASPAGLEAAPQPSPGSRTQVEAWRDLLSESSQLQDAVQANEATTRTLLYYSPTVIPGLLQTPTYAWR